MLKEFSDYNNNNQRKIQEDERREGMMRRYIHLKSLPNLTESEKSELNIGATMFGTLIEE